MCPSLLGTGQQMALSCSLSSLVLGSTAAAVRSRTLQVSRAFASPYTWVWDLPGGWGVLMPVATAKLVWELLGRLRSQGSISVLPSRGE